ncbi:AgmX/PglI C-terminal domain-containing protein [Myxococcus sp. RHSTA-1-4]|uniref:AgmX/PglI C-terminal domain-containing protein n=1 Tax=Myxococcus sp. RHSTA-1-4 TaxID=2874601 RepID=UPI001CC0E5AB|nr:AgmX/PglI C-terminal domain-containing protein [Myxococcus sp. RHSTA-1-4]MBZ4415650.1 AgmX/PglI C-terminal domain-containing protein [Myxococcus sp. RHSTA-1-4]
MVGNSGDAGANLGGLRGSLSEEAEAGAAPVLDGVSDAELDAFVGKLRTDKSRIVPNVAEPRSRGDMLAERLHRGRPLVSAVREQEVACQSWYVGLDAQASGPHDFEALKGYWERGELGPDSLCWREGFSAWVPLCQVPELAEALAPLPQERLPEPGGDTEAPSFELKGAEALRSLSEDGVSLELDLEAARVELSAPVSTREPVLGAITGAVGMPAPVAASAHGSGFTEAGHASAHGAPSVNGSGFSEVGSTPVDPVGTHSVLVTAPGAGRGEVRWRGVLWLALLGGVSGGVTVAIVLALLGSGEGRALLARLSPSNGAGPSATLSAGPATPGSVAAPAGGHANAVTGTGSAPGAVSGAPGSGVVPGAAGGAAPGAANTAAVPGAPSSPGAMGPGAAGVGAMAGATGPGAGAVPGGIAGSSLVPRGGIDRGGAVPALSATGGAVASSATSVPSVPKTELSTVSPPSRAPAARPSVSAAALALEKRPVAPPAVTETSFESDDDLGLDEAPAAEEKSASALGPDEAYDRELSGPPPGAASARKERTVYVPPDPSKPPAELAQSDIFEVVLANKGDITACARELQQPPKEGGRVVVRWSILPTGKVGEVVTETASIQGTPLARCIEAKVRAWNFPRHQGQGAPVRFPFVF